MYNGTPVQCNIVSLLCKTFILKSQARGALERILTHCDCFKILHRSITFVVRIRPFIRKKEGESSPSFACQDLRIFCMPMANLYVKNVHILLEF